MNEHKTFPLLSFSQIYKLSRGEICVANFIPPANGASQGNYFQAKIQKTAVFETKRGLQKLRRHTNMQTFFELFCQS